VFETNREKVCKKSETSRWKSNKRRIKTIKHTKSISLQKLVKTFDLIMKFKQKTSQILIQLFLIACFTLAISCQHDESNDNTTLHLTSDQTATQHHEVLYNVANSSFNATNPNLVVVNIVDENSNGTLSTNEGNWHFSFTIVESLFFICNDCHLKIKRRHLFRGQPNFSIKYWVYLATGTHWSCSQPFVCFCWSSLV